MSSLSDVLDRIINESILDDLQTTQSHKARTRKLNEADNRQFYDIHNLYTTHGVTPMHDDTSEAKTCEKTIIEWKKPDKIKDVIFDKNATTIIWTNGEKTTVKAHHEPIDHEKGLAMAMVKHVYQSGDGSSNKASFYKLIANAEDAELDRIVKKAMKELRKVYSDAYVKECDKISTGALDDDAHEALYNKALKATMRVRKKYIPTETGLPMARIEEAIQEALEKYSANCMRQRVF